MDVKQAIVQVVAIIAIPLLIIGTYVQFFRNQEQVEPSTPGQELVAQGTKVREALAIIDRLRFDASLFAIPAFAELLDQTVPIRDEIKGREIPFSRPEVLRAVDAAAAAASAKQGVTPTRR